MKTTVEIADPLFKSKTLRILFRTAEGPEGLGTFLNKATSARDKQYYSQFQKLLADAKAITNQAERAKMYEQGQRLLAESAILVPMWSNNLQAFAIYQKNVKGVVLNPDMNFRTWTIFKE